MKKIKGNLIDLAIDGTFNLIFHGANCFHRMGSGVAKEIHERLPQAYYEADLKTPYGDPKKLGTISKVGITKNDHSFIVVNCYTQYHYGRDPKVRYVEYWAVKEAMKSIRTDIINYRVKDIIKIGLPKIGAGLGNGDWNIIEKIIENELGEYDITLVEL